MRDEVNIGFKRAQFNTKIEQKYKYDEEEQQMVKDDKIPGDIFACSYDQWNDYYFDAVVGNISAESYIKSSSKERLWLAKKKEDAEILKYRDLPHFIPLAVGVMGGMGDRFKFALQNLAHKIATINEIAHSVMMNRIRNKIIAVLMKYNAKMVISSMLIS